MNKMTPTLRKFYLAPALRIAWRTLSSDAGFGGFSRRLAFFLLLNLCFGAMLVAQNELSCSCTDYLYLNDPVVNMTTGTNEVHKFRIDPDGSLTEIGSPWLAPDVPGGSEPLNSPHGISIDQSGNIYVGDVTDFTGGQPGNIVKLSCNGDILENPLVGPDVWGYNTGLVGNDLYIPILQPNEIQIWDVCTGLQTGTINTDFDLGWGFAVSRDEQSYYYTTGWFTADNNQLVKGSVDGSTPEMVLYDFGNNIGAFMGVAEDNLGNVYVVYTEQNGGLGPAQVLKISPTGTLLASSPLDNTLTQNAGVTSGYYGARGIVWSQAANQVYVGSQEDCISTFDADLNYLPAQSIGYVPGSESKGIGITTECCPGTSENVQIDSVVCVLPTAPISLYDLIPCDGPLCGGAWSETSGNPNFSFDPCDNSIGVSGSGCASYNLSSGGAGNTGECGNFNITVTICVAVTPEIDFVVECAFDGATGGSSFFGSGAIDGTSAMANETVEVAINGTVVATLTLDANGQAVLPATPLGGPSFNNTVSVTPVDYAKCSSLQLFDLIACTPACTGAAGEVGGNVFLDNNSDGADAGAVEVGQGNVLVRVYDCDGNLACEVYTNANGDWSCGGLTEGEEYRVEYTTPETPWLTESFVGPDNGTSVQFVTPDGSCAANLGLLDPQEYCNQVDLSLAVSCYESGSLEGPNATNPAFISFSNDATGGTQEPNKDISLGELGTVYGTAHNPATNLVYTGTLLKRHSAVADGYGYVYELDYTDVNAPTFVQGINLEGVVAANTGQPISFGDVCRDATCANDAGNTGVASDYTLPDDPTAPSIDLDAFGKVGTVGFGDVDYDQNTELLWMVNLNERTLVSMDLSGNLPGTVNSYPIAGGTGVPACTGGEIRPWALEFSQGRGYLGVVCDASLSQDGDDLIGYILSFDPIDPDAGFSVVTEVAFNTEFNRADFPDAPFDNDPSNGFFQGYGDPMPWAQTYTDLPQRFRDSTDARPGLVTLRMLQPIISDLDFDAEGNLVVGVMDRTTLQLSFLQNLPISQTTEQVNVLAYGDIYWYCNENGTFVKEAEGSCPGPFNFGGDYFDLQVADGSNDGALGSFIILNNEGELVNTVWDPLDPGVDPNDPAFNDDEYLDTQGLHWNSLNDGSRTDWYRIIQRATTRQGIGKGLGLGDLIALCDAPPIQIGNYAWQDEDADGLQDACEPPLEGLTVKLFSKPADGSAPTLLATTMTDATGNYYFAGDGLDLATWEDVEEDTLVAGNNYFVAFCGEDGYDAEADALVVNGMIYCLSPADAGASDLIDSDVSVQTVGAEGLLPAYCSQDSETDGTNHTFDAGFKLACPFVELTTDDPTLCSTDTLALAVLVDSVLTANGYTYEWVTSGDGTFLDAGGAVIADYATAVSYVPGSGDATNGPVSLTLRATAATNPAHCPLASDEVVLTVQKADCGSFFWDGGQ